MEKDRIASTVFNNREEFALSRCRYHRSGSEKIRKSEGEGREGPKAAANFSIPSDAASLHLYMAYPLLMLFYREVAEVQTQ